MSIKLITRVKGVLNIVSGVKYQFFVCWQYVTYVTNFSAFYILLHSLNDTSKGILFHSRTDFSVK